MTNYVRNGNQDEANERMIQVMTRIATDLERVIIGLFMCLILLAIIAGELIAK